MKNVQPIHVCIADDHAYYRDGLKYCINECNDLSIDFEAENGEELINKLRLWPRLPDICLLDVNMPVMDGYEAIRKLNGQWPLLKVLVLTQYNDQYVIRDMLTYGARGFLLKNLRREELQQAINDIYYKGYYYSSLVPEVLFKEIHNNKLSAEKITLREKELLKIICEGLSYKEIADRLHISLRTVEKHRDNIFQKLKINSKSELIAFVFKNGLVS